VPAADWLSLARAVFTFGVAADDISADLHDKALDRLTTGQIAEIGIKEIEVVIAPMIGTNRFDRFRTNAFRPFSLRSPINLYNPIARGLS
jgi:hypothetical protein